MLLRILKSLMFRFDKEKHAGVCEGCDEGYRPIDPDHWSTPEPCPLCQYSNSLGDKKLLERYKVGHQGCIHLLTPLEQASHNSTTARKYREVHHVHLISGNIFEVDGEERC